MAASNTNRAAQGQPFIVNREGDAGDLSAKKRAMLEEIAAIEAAELREKQERELEERQRRQTEQAIDMQTLDECRAQLVEVEESLKYVTTKEDVGELLRTKRKLQKGISEIETKYAMNQPVEAVSLEPVPAPHKGKFWETAWQIVALLVVCWGIVLYSGDWIVSKYPNAAVYNEVSFQKVLFAFSVYVGGVVAVICILTIFFPGLGKYFNPFNHGDLDFFDDFKTLNAWQRNVISLLLFFCLLLAYVFIVAGKLD
jgi:hypothetical protein